MFCAARRCRRSRGHADGTGRYGDGQRRPLRPISPWPAPAAAPNPHKQTQRRRRPALAGEDAVPSRSSDGHGTDRRSILRHGRAFRQFGERLEGLHSLGVDQQTVPAGVKQTANDCDHADMNTKLIPIKTASVVSTIGSPRFARQEVCAGPFHWQFRSKDRARDSLRMAFDRRYVILRHG